MAIDSNEKISENPFVTTSESSNEATDESHAPWQTVERYRKKPGKASEIGPRASRNTKPRMNDQERSDPIKEAEKQRILKRKQAEERARSLERLPSLGEGPSKSKVVDPRNWGGIDIDPTELNIEAQRDALQAWRKAFEWAKSNPRETEEEDSASATSKTDKDEDAIQLAVEQAEARVRKLYKLY